MTSREIITLQLGNYANYVGTHWWNIQVRIEKNISGLRSTNQSSCLYNSILQESSFSYDPNAPASEINHDILFREGANARGDVTYTPRMLLVDLKGSLKSLPLSGGDLYGRPDVDALIAGGDAMLWDADGKLDVHRDGQNRLGVTDGNDETEEDVEQGIADRDDGAASSTAETIDDDQADEAAAAAAAAVPNFSQTIETWTDFVHTRYHPRSINLIDAALDHSASEAGLDTFSAGRTLWRGAQFEDGDFGDHIRQYIEECNNCQAFQVLFDAADGFTGLAAAGCEHLLDEYGKAVLGVPVFSGDFRAFRSADKATNDSIRVINTALAYAEMLAGEASGGSGSAAMLLPLSASRQVWRQRSGARELPLFAYNVSNAYETSSVLAAYLDTISLEYRHPAAANTVSTFCSSLTNYGRRLATAGVALPFRFGVDEQLINALDALELEEAFVPLSPNSKLGTQRIVQHVAVRGIPEERLKRPLAQAGDQIRMAAYNCNSVSEMLGLYFQCGLYGSLTHVRSVQRGLPVRRPFPVELFDGRVQTPKGWWQEWETEASGGEKKYADEVPVMACVQTGQELAHTLESLHREASRVRIARIPRFAASGLEQAELSEALESLLLFKDNYDDAYEL